MKSYAPQLKSAFDHYFEAPIQAWEEFISYCEFAAFKKDQVMLHTIEDATVNHLILDQHMVIASGKEIWSSPIVGVISSVLYLIVGLLLRHYRIRKTQ